MRVTTISLKLHRNNGWEYGFRGACSSDLELRALAASYLGRGEVRTNAGWATRCGGNNKVSRKAASGEDLSAYKGGITGSQEKNVSTLGSN